MTKAERLKTALRCMFMSFEELLNESYVLGDVFEKDLENGLIWFEYPDNSLACFFIHLQEIQTYGSK